MQNKQNGKIIVIIGPMFSGKSTKLIEYINRYVYKKKKVIMLKFHMDTRYSENEVLVTHDKREYPAIPVSEIGPMVDSIKDYEVIGIDEGQFYCDVIINNPDR
jgi:thymidine kinase